MPVVGLFCTVLVKLKLLSANGMQQRLLTMMVPDGGSRTELVTL